jgi:uncharacterized membrane protein
MKNLLTAGAMKKVAEIIFIYLSFITFGICPVLISAMTGIEEYGWYIFVTIPIGSLLIVVYTIYLIIKNVYKKRIQRKPSKITPTAGT